MNAELEQLDLLARLDEFVERLRRAADPPAAWLPQRSGQALLKRVLTRIGEVRLRLESPLVVATFGGTGTGKSALVNALVGCEATVSGRERPTTRRPVLLVHPDVPVEALGLPLDEFDVRRIPAPLLRDVVLLDCPDPDTTEDETPGSNLARLHRLLPLCDVLLYVSTQQKYRSARVGDELLQAAAGCRLVFVQTHADRDTDIRDDWRRQLAGRFEIPEMFFVDSVAALADQQAGRRPAGDLARLQDLLAAQLARTQRVRIRRANLLDLLHDALVLCRDRVHRVRPKLEELQSALDVERDRLVDSLSAQLSTELSRSRATWERRLVGEVVSRWGLSPFSAVLRLYHGLGGWLASFGLWRARNSAQVALIGAVQTARWFRDRQAELETEERLAGSVDALPFAWNDDELAASRIRTAGWLQEADFDPEQVRLPAPDALRSEAGRTGGRLLTDAARRIDGLIDDLARRNTGRLCRIGYESMLCLFLGFVLFRMTKNFFFDSFVGGEAVLPWDFYVSAGAFLALWSGGLVTAFVGRLRRGLDRSVREATASSLPRLAQDGPYRELSAACAEAAAQAARWDAWLAETDLLRTTIAPPGGLGARRPLPEPAALPDSAARPAIVETTASP